MEANANNIKEFLYIFKEAKVHRGPQSRGVSKLAQMAMLHPCTREVAGFSLASDTGYHD
jgi:hypothetical protein